MPKLWTATIAEHRHDVSEAIIDAAAVLVARDGLLGVTMSAIAESAGIGRATLYKYFPDVEAVLRSWHQREIERHLAALAAARDSASDAKARVKAVLATYAAVASSSQGHHDSGLAALLHRDDQVARAHQTVIELVRHVLSEGVREGVVRTDVPVDELAAYCVYSLTAASTFRSKAAVSRLIETTLAGLRPDG